MKTKTLFLVTLSLSLLTSCSTVNQTLVRVNESTSKTLLEAKEKTLGPAKPKLRLTKADPNRFLPTGTSIDSLGKKKKAAAKPTRLLSKNTTSQAAERSPASFEVPPLVLPPLPEASSDDPDELMGILPSLDESNEATFIDVDGETPELPPMDIPDYMEESDETDSEKSA